MSFQEAVDKWCSEHSGKKLAELVGCHPSSISSYRDGAEPEPERKQKIIEIIGYKEEEPEKVFEPEIEYMDRNEAAKRLGICKLTLEAGLRQGVYPFGIAFKGRGESYNYFIYKRDFEEFIEKHKWPQ